MNNTAKKVCLRSQDCLRSQGFTLMELLLVIVLLGFLITAGVSSYTSTLRKSRDTKRKNDLRQIAVSLEAYNNDGGRYPLGDGIEGAIIGCNDDSPTPATAPEACTWNSGFIKNGTTYMVTLPGDASSTQRYFYVSDGLAFQLYARLENTQDSDVPKDASNHPRAFSGGHCGTSGINCNYGVSSSNIAVDANQDVIYE